MPRWARRPRRRLTGSTSRRPRRVELGSSPSRPAAISPPSARDGLQLASEAFSSALVDASSSPERTARGRRLAVVVPPAGERARPEVRDEPLVRVEARHRQAAQPGEVSARTPAMKAGRNVESLSGCSGLVEQVAFVPLPGREVDVGAVARPGRATASARARRSGPCRAATPRMVSRTSTCWSAAVQRRRRGDRDLLLAVAELGVVLLERDPLLGEGPRPRARRCSPATRSSRSSRSRATVSTGTKSSPSMLRERELVQKGRLQGRPPRSASRSASGAKGTGAGRCSQGSKSSR